MRKFFPVLLLSLSVGAAVALWYAARAGYAAHVSKPKKAGVLLAVTERRREIGRLLPQPLRYSSDSAGASILTVEGVFEWTNSFRGKEGLEPLELNNMLSQAAERKLSDMFDREYFAHVSPLGVKPADLVSNAGYDYLFCGENLAMGNFRGDEELVVKWMESPGHRHNILNRHYTEIGIAAGRGRIEGRDTWLAVQTFATPASVCPKPDEALRAEIEANNTALNQQFAAIEELQEAASAVIEPASEEQFLRQINQLISDRNNLAEANQENILRYNQAVLDYNQCLKQMDGEDKEAD